MGHALRDWFPEFNQWSGTLTPGEYERVLIGIAEYVASNANLSVLFKYALKLRRDKEELEERLVNELREEAEDLDSIYLRKHWLIMDHGVRVDHDEYQVAFRQARAASAVASSFGCNQKGDLENALYEAIFGVDNRPHFFEFLRNNFGISLRDPTSARL